MVSSFLFWTVVEEVFVALGAADPLAFKMGTLGQETGTK